MSRDYLCTKFPRFINATFNEHLNQITRSFLIITDRIYAYGIFNTYICEYLSGHHDMDEKIEVSYEIVFE